MHATVAQPMSTATDRFLTATLVAAPVAYLLADSLYAARGWDDGTAGVVHVVGAVLYGFVVLRLVSWSTGWLQTAALVAGIVGTAGNVAYGIDTIHVSLGATKLVDAGGSATIIKPLGLCFPLWLLLAAVVVARTGRRAGAVLVAVAAVLWPVAHIANVAPLAVVTNAALVAGLAPLALAGWTFVGEARAAR